MSETILIQSSGTKIPLEDESVDCVVTSPPYLGKRKYPGEQKILWEDGWYGELGDEPQISMYVEHIREIWREVWRVLKPRGTCWLNIGDSYAGSNNGSNDYRPKGASISKDDRKYKGQKPGKLEVPRKNLCLIPSRVAIALQDDGWVIRNDVIWLKTNGRPESVRDRLTCVHEYVWYMTKGSKNYFDYEAILEPYDGPINRWGGDTLKRDTSKTKEYKEMQKMRPDPRGRRKRTVWAIPTDKYSGAHFAVFPPALIEPCILAGCPEGGVVLDPFCGSGTTLQVACKLGRQGVGLDLSYYYLDKLARKRVGLDQPSFL